MKNLRWRSKPNLNRLKNLRKKGGGGGGAQIPPTAQSQSYLEYVCRNLGGPSGFERDSPIECELSGDELS